MEEIISRYLPVLEAFKDARYLLSRGYNFDSVIRIVTTRYLLGFHEKNVLVRLLSGYGVRFKKLKVIRAPKLLIDGYNVLITLSVLKNKGILVKSIDGLIRDVESKHGKNISIENMKESVKFLEDLIRNKLSYKNEVLILLEKNISRSGELARFIESSTSLHARLSGRVDSELIELARTTKSVVATSDSLIISRVGKVFPLTLFALRFAVPRVLISPKRIQVFE